MVQPIDTNDDADSAAADAAASAFTGVGDRVVCESRQLVLWMTMLGGLRAETDATLPRLPEELWLLTFGFLKHDQQPTFAAQDA